MLMYGWREGDGITSHHGKRRVQKAVEKRPDGAATPPGPPVGPAPGLPSRPVGPTPPVTRGGGQKVPGAGAGAGLDGL